MERSGYDCLRFRVQRKSVFHPAIRASCSEHVLPLKSFQLAPKPFLMTFHLGIKLAIFHTEDSILSKCTNPCMHLKQTYVSGFSFHTLMLIAYYSLFF